MVKQAKTIKALKARVRRLERAQRRDVVAKIKVMDPVELVSLMRPLYVRWRHHGPSFATAAVSQPPAPSSATDEGAARRLIAVPGSSARMPVTAIGEGPPAPAPAPREGPLARTLSTCLMTGMAPSRRASS